MKNFILLLCIFGIAKATYGQDGSKKLHAEFTDRDAVLKLDVLLPAIGVEARISNHNTFLFSYQPGFVSNQVNNEPSQLYVITQFRGATRFFYNIDSHIERGKRTDKFSGNFISLSALYGLSSSITSEYVTLGPTWGLQRNWGGIVHFSFELGFGYTFGNLNAPYTIIGDLKLGFAL